MLCNKKNEKSTSYNNLVRLIIKMQYNIHYNYEIPYIIRINDNHVIITNNETSQVIFDENVVNVFIGKDIRRDGVHTLVYDSSTNMIHDEKVNDDYDRIDGNTILLQLNNGNEYMYIGGEIYTFTTSDNIIDYISPIGNNDVPYPYAIGTQNVYLMIGYKFIDKTKVCCDDPYKDYYDVCNVASGIKYMNEQRNKQLAGEPYDNVIDEDEDEIRKEEQKYFNIPVSTQEDHDKYIEYRVKKFNIDKKYLERYHNYANIKYKIFN